MKRELPLLLKELKDYLKLDSKLSMLKKEQESILRFLTNNINKPELL
jgi:hypothetical protein